MTPSCQTTARAAQLRTRNDSRCDCAYRNTSPPVRKKLPRKKSTTRWAPAAMSPMTLAKPMMCTSTAEPGTKSASNFSPHLVSMSLATARKSSRCPVVGSNSSSSALMIAPEKSFATSRPTMPALRMLRRTAARPSGVGREVVGDDVARGDAVLDDLGVAHVRREQRLHARPVDAGQEEDLVGGALQRVEELRREHVRRRGPRSRPAAGSPRRTPAGA